MQVPPFMETSWNLQISIYQPQHKQRLPVPHPSRPATVPGHGDCRATWRFPPDSAASLHARPTWDRVWPGLRSPNMVSGDFKHPKCVCVCFWMETTMIAMEKKWVDFGFFHDLKQQLAIPKKESSLTTPLFRRVDHMSRVGRMVTQKNRILAVTNL